MPRTSRLLPLLLLLVTLLASACTQPPDPNADDGYTSACPDEGCPNGTTCNDLGRCVVDDGTACVDNDEDGHGINCTLGPDCDDTEYFVNPLITETCDGVDNNCDGAVDEDRICDQCEAECEPGVRECVGASGWRECFIRGGCAVWKPTVYCDAGCVDGACVALCDDFDGDGWGAGCEAGPDCNDRNPFAFPGNPEVCDGYDNNCDGRTDEGDVCDTDCPPICTPGEHACAPNNTTIACFNGIDGCPAWSDPTPCRDLECIGGRCEDPERCTDIDGDGVSSICGAPADCDDTQPEIHPGAAEICDGLDNDCDGQVDGLPGCPTSACADAHDTIETAIPFSRGQTLAAFTCPNRAVLIDLGVWEAQSTVLVMASSRPASDHLTMELLTERDGALTPGPSSDDQPAAVTLTPMTPAHLFARITRPALTPTPFLLAATSTADARCDGDEEPNNAPDQGVLIGHHGIVAFTRCANDLDFFRLEPPSRWALTADLLTPAQLPEVLLEIWRDGAAATPDQRLRPGRRHAHTRVDLNGDTHVLIRGAANQPIPYLLAVQAYAPGTCAEDTSEGGDANDELSSATPISVPGGAEATLCPGDLDWYALGTYQQGQLIDVNVDFDFRSFNLDAWLFLDDLSGLTQVALQDDANERLPINAPRTGRYYVLVQGRGPLDGGPYTLRANGP